MSLFFFSSYFELFRWIRESSFNSFQHLASVNFLHFSREFSRPKRGLVTRIYFLIPTEWCTGGNSYQGHSGNTAPTFLMTNSDRKADFSPFLLHNASKLHFLSVHVHERVGVSSPLHSYRELRSTSTSFEGFPVTRAPRATSSRAFCL